MGVATTDSDLRVLAAIGKIDEAPSEFLPCDDVSYGGVLIFSPSCPSNAFTASESYEPAQSYRCRLGGSHPRWAGEPLSPRYAQVSDLYTHWAVPFFG